MSRILDVSGINPATKKPWFGVREIPWKDMRIEMRWVNHQTKETPATAGDGNCLHWTADRHVVVYNDYEVTAVMNAKKEAFLVKAVANDEKQAHLWKRNSIINGQAAAADPTVPGREPHINQVEILAQWVAEKCAWRKIDPRGKITIPQMACNAAATESWFTGKSITVPTIWDHAHYALVDGYGRHRWDANWKLPGANGLTMFAYFEKRVLAMYDELKAGKRQFEFSAYL